ncbi:MAG: DUF3825 domain-containing protein [Solirubrobacteraceae bacterium]
MLRWKIPRDETGRLRPVEFVEEAEDGETGVDAPEDAPAEPPAAVQASPPPAAPAVEREARPDTSGGPPRAGVVAFWHMHHEYGFIRPEDPSEPDVWVNVEALEGFAEPLPHLAKGEHVLYEAVPSEMRSRGASHKQDARQRAIRVLPARPRVRGVVSEYSFTHGYGSIAADDGRRYFLHRSNILEGDYPDVGKGDEVFFTASESDARPGRDPDAEAIKVADPRPALHRFAQFPYDRGQWLGALARRALPESWDHRHESAADGDQYPILRHYMEATFERLLQEQSQGRRTILEGSLANGHPYAVFDTGLRDRMRRPIYALFDEHRDKDDPRRWWWRGFLAEGEGPMREVAELPPPADYLKDPSALVVTPDEVAGMRVDTTHILGDHLARFPAHLRSQPELARQVFEGALRELPDRIRRNYRLAVAQYYRGSIHLLLPLHLGAAQHADLALAVERTASGRRASTVLGKDYAYRQARVIARPERDWLAEAWLTPDDA